ncbi:MAG: PaaI family thioesterase [Burkholderiaceae bacterium]|jgi:uncharacterized protein (TIGR00369 family)
MSVRSTGSGVQPETTTNPFMAFLGVNLVQWKNGYVELQLPVRPELGNRTGRVQGGVICTLLDLACGYAGLFTPEGEPTRYSLTLSLTTNFLDSREGTVLTAKGFLDREGRTVFFSRGEVWVDDTHLVATAVGTFKYIRSR